MKLIRQAYAAHHALIWRFARFAMVGFSGFFVDLGFFHLAFDVLGFNHYASAFFSFPFVATYTWLGNRIFTFRGRNQGSAHAQWMRFLAVCAVGVTINRGTFSLLVATVPLVYLHPVLGLIAGTGAGMFFNFFCMRKLVFK